MTTKPQKQEIIEARRSAMEAVEAAFATLDRIDTEDNDRRTYRPNPSTWLLVRSLIIFAVKKYGAGAIITMTAEFIGQEDNLAVDDDA